MSVVVSEANAVRPAHPGQGPRSNIPSAADTGDQTSPFAAVLEGTNDTAPPPTALPPASSTTASQKPAVRPQDGTAAQSSASDTATGTQKPPSGGSPATDGQAGDASSSQSNGPKGTDGVQTVLGALGNKAAKDATPKIDANIDVAATNVASSATAGNSAVDATAGSSTAAATIEIHGDTKKSDSSTSDSAQAAAAPADPSANQPIPAAPQPVAVAISAPAIPVIPVIPAAPTTSESGSAGDSGTGQDAAQIAALGDAAKAGALGGKPDGFGADAAKSGSPQPRAKTADTTASTPSLTLQPVQKDLAQPGGPGQPNAAGGTQSGSAGAVPVAEAATNRVRQRTLTGQPTDGTAGLQSGPNDNSNGNSNVDPNVEPNADPKLDPAASTNQIADITRQALDTTVRRVEAPAADSAGDGTSSSGDVQAGSIQPAPDGAGSANAPVILATAPAAAPATTQTPTAIPISGLAVEIAAQARAGKSRFDIRLDPPELGRIDVRLDVDRDGKVTSRLVVERPETLDLLQRDAPQLERSLQDAGLKTADNALQFSLRDQGGSSGQNPYPNNGSPTGAARLIIPDRDLPPVDATAAAYTRLNGTRAGVDIRV